MFLLPGTVLDIQDDSGGEVFRSVFSERALIPESVKVALDISHFPELDDRHFALRFHNHGQTFRKFATVDPGHSILSAIYLLKTAHLLPVEAQKVAAQGIWQAFEDQGMECPSILYKMAHEGLFLYGDKTAGVMGAIGSGAKWLAGKAMSPVVNSIKANPIGAAMTGMSVAATGSEISNNLSALKGPQGNMVGGVKEAATRLSKEMSKDPSGGALLDRLRHMADPAFREVYPGTRRHVVGDQALLEATVSLAEALHANGRSRSLGSFDRLYAEDQVRSARGGLRATSPHVPDIPLWKRRPEGFDPRVIEQLTKAEEGASPAPRPGMGWKGKAGLVAAAIPLAAGALYFGHKQLKKREARLGDPQEAESEMTPKAAELTGTLPMAYGALPRHKPFKPPAMPHKMAMLDLSHVDRPLPPAVEMDDTHFALGTRYPLTTEGQTKMACAYFEEHSSGFSVEDRREFAYNLCKRAAELDMAGSLGPTAIAYGGKPCRDVEPVKVALLQRRTHGGEKVAEIVDTVLPHLEKIAHEERLQLLTLIDRDHGLESFVTKGWITDPILATHEKWAAEEEFSEEVAGFRVTASSLEMLARHQKVLREAFSRELAQKMLENPVSTFKALPRPLKVLAAKACVAASNGETAPARTS